MPKGGPGPFARSLMFQNDEELGKRDDDYRHKLYTNRGIWHGATRMSPTLRYRSKKRWLGISAALFAVWVFWHFMPADILEPSPRLGAVRQSGHNQGRGGQWESGEPKGPPPRSGKRRVVKQEDLDHFYDGPVRFYQLPNSLQASSTTNGYLKRNKNVMFAASSLKSLAVVIPMACEMAKWETNFVHVVVFARSGLGMEEIQDINGVEMDGCKVFWHDARPDFPRYSSDFRVEAAVAAAMEHIDVFMHPQVVITDDSMVEDVWFTRQLRIKAKQYDWPVIELPKEKQDRLKWITRLETRALAAWHKSSIDIVVQAPSSSFGSLMRLLKSLSAADYSGLTHPSITLELPADVDAMTRAYLSRFEWPPTNALQPVHASRLTLRHRIPGQKISAEEASVRFFESFYPASVGESHVLLLSVNAELSPAYFHYLKYSLLRYKNPESGSLFSNNVVGLSLNMPSVYLNGSTPFTPPNHDYLELAVQKQAKPIHKNTNPPFLWQAPNNNAALYFGDKWVELHSFLQHRLTKFHSTSDATVLKKTVSEQFPAWMEYALEFMRARGYSLLYPPSSPRFDALVTIHQEQYHAPEEFSPQAPRNTEPEAKGPPFLSNEPFLIPKPGSITAPKGSETPLAAMSHQSLDSILPYEGQDPDLALLPHLAFNGLLLESHVVFDYADKFAKSFRKEVGGCKDVDGEEWNRGFDGGAADLFCGSS